MAQTTKELFRAWRGGDAQSGQDMAQRFADWYYAIATSRLGETRGRGPCDTACNAFGAGIVGVSDAKTLVTWAHGLIQVELETSGARAHDGDEPSSFTGNQHPKALLAQCREALPAEVALLEACYSATKRDDAEIDQLAAALGGMPLGILNARYATKRWLRDNANVPFDVAPDKPVLDRAPLPLYEADRMKNRAEETRFEQWMLTDIDLCKDIAEFAHFSIALRGGIPDAAEATTTSAPAKPVPQPSAQSAAPPSTEVAQDTSEHMTESGGGKAAIGVVAVLALLGVITVIVILLAIAAMMWM
jgi:hypothetical protein